MQNVITYTPRNKVGEYTRTKLAKAKLVAQKAIRITVYTYLVVTFIGTLIAIHLVKETYTWRCTVNGVPIGYLTRNVQCQDANERFIDSVNAQAEQNNANNLELNPDLQ